MVPFSLFSWNYFIVYWLDQPKNPFFKIGRMSMLTHSFSSLLSLSRPLSPSLFSLPLSFSLSPFCLLFLSSSLSLFLSSLSFPLLSLSLYLSLSLTLSPMLTGDGLSRRLQILNEFISSDQFFTDLATRKKTSRMKFF